MTRFLNCIFIIVIFFYSHNVEATASDNVHRWRKTLEVDVTLIGNLHVSLLSCCSNRVWVWPVVPMHCVMWLQTKLHIFDNLQLALVLTVIGSNSICLCQVPVSCHGDEDNMAPHRCIWEAISNTFLFTYILKIQYSQ